MLGFWGFGTKRNALKHLREVEDCCKSIYNFALDGEDYFCYLDGKKFNNRLQLLEHFADCHREEQDKLAQWGINWRAALSQADFLSGRQAFRLEDVKSRMKRITAEHRKQAV